MTQPHRLEDGEDNDDNDETEAHDGADAVKPTFT